MGDNAAGSAVIMEAARILSKLGIRPKRTIRFALWSGEEQVLGGSLAYIEQHLATRAPSTDPVANELHPYYGWKNRWPIMPSPGYYELAAYFNVDNGSGKIRGIYAEGNPALVSIFREWFEPFESMGAATTSAQRTGDTDHELMQAVGIPAFQFIQDPLDYGERVHHSSIDSYDHLRIEDLKQAAVILASFLLNAANLEESLPRMPLPTKPSVTDPFAYEDPDLEGQDGGIAEDGGQGRNRTTDTRIFSSSHNRQAALCAIGWTARPALAGLPFPSASRAPCSPRPIFRSSSMRSPCSSRSRSSSWTATAMASSGRMEAAKPRS